MTAWIVVVLPMCLMAKCAVDFIALEYGGRFQFISDDYLLVICAIMCAYALFVDIVNLIGRMSDSWNCRELRLKHKWATELTIEMEEK